MGHDQPYDEIAARLGMTPGALKVAVHRLRRRYARVIRDRIAQTVASNDDVDGEIAYLMKVVGRGPRT